MSLIHDAVADDERKARNANEPESVGALTDALIGRVLGNRDAFANALPRGVHVDDFLRNAAVYVGKAVADSVYTGSPSLLECVDDSVLGALMTCAQLGIMPFWDNDLQLAYLDVRYNSRYAAPVAQFRFTYRGMIKAAFDAGTICDIYAERVHGEVDEFHYEHGTYRKLVHVPDLAETRAGTEVTHYYAFSTLTNGVDGFTVMHRAEVEAHARRWASVDDQGQLLGLWGDPVAFHAMALKTVLRARLRALPQTAVLARVDHAEGSVRLDHADARVRLEEVSDREEVPEAAPVQAPPAPVESTAEDETTHSG